MIDPNHKWNVRISPLIWGLLSALLLTFLAYFIAIAHIMSGWALVCTLLGLATTQAIFQLIFFLHLGVETKPRWNVMIFLFMLLIMIIVVGGSIWIMDSLDYNMMPRKRYEKH